MIRFISIITFLFICSSGISQIAEAIKENVIKSKCLTKEQEDLIFKKISLFPNNTQLSIAFIENGVPSFYGVKKQSNEIIVIDNYNKVFEIGSITKIFTSTILADFVVENQLKLQDKIRAQVRFPIEIGEDVTFMQLSNHTSGLPRLPTNLVINATNMNNPYAKYDEKKLKKYLAEEVELDFPPGEEYNYSNLGTGLLGFLLTKYSNKSYEDLLQSLIFFRYEMNNSTTNIEKVKNNLIPGLDKHGNETSNWNFSSLVGAGGILSTAEDLSKFAIAQFNDCDIVLNKTRVPTFTINENQSVALGWHIIKKNGLRLFSHNGGTGGYSSSISVDPLNQNAIIVLSNVSAFNKEAKNIEDLGFKLMRNLKKSLKLDGAEF